jgi:hypothetical protein
MLLSQLPSLPPSTGIATSDTARPQLSGVCAEAAAMRMSSFAQVAASAILFPGFSVTGASPDFSHRLDELTGNGVGCTLG